MFDMKKLLFLFLLFPILIFSQEKKQKKIKVFDNKTLWITTNFSEKKTTAILDSITNSGYYTLKLDSIKDSPENLNLYVNKGNFLKKVLVRLDSLSEVATQFKNNFTTSNVDSLSNIIHYFYLKKGFAFNKVHTKINFNKSPIEANIHVELYKKRKINSFVLNGYKKMPKGFKKELEFNYLGKTYDDNKLIEISKLISSTNFLENEKNPQVLFTPDSTVVYLYLKKRKSSAFDGIIGFGNDDKGKFNVTGKISLSLGNIFNSFEKLSINWLSTANKSQNLDVSYKIPYLFKSKFGSTSTINIFKQDSTYATVNLKEHIYYQYTHEQQIGLTTSYESSNYLLDEGGNDYEKTGLGADYEFLIQNPSIVLGNNDLYTISATYYNNVPEEGKRIPQYKLYSHLEKLLHLGKNHYLKTKLEASTLLSDTLVVNELSRLGGFSSIRGFNEESVYASSYVLSSLEYRYVPFEELFLSVFLDLAWTENKPQKTHQTLVGSGLGMNFLTKFGVFSINYAVGKFNGEPINFSDSKIHIGLTATF